MGREVSPVISSVFSTQGAKLLQQTGARSAISGEVQLFKLQGLKTYPI